MGFGSSTSDFVLFLDADDELRGDYVTRLAAAAAGFDTDLVVGRVLQMDELGVVRTEYAYRDKPKDPRELLARYLVDPIQTTGLMWRRDFIVREGGWDEAFFVGDDRELAIRLMLRLQAFAIADTDDSYAMWRHHDGARITSNWTQEKFVDRLESLLKHKDAMLRLGDARVAHGLAVRFYHLSRWAFMEGFYSVGRDALRQARALGFSGHLGNLPHRLACAALGLELKSTLSNRLRAMSVRAAQ